MQITCLSFMMPLQFRSNKVGILKKGNSGDFPCLLVLSELRAVFCGSFSLVCPEIRTHASV